MGIPIFFRCARILSMIVFRNVSNEMMFELILIHVSHSLAIFNPPLCYVSFSIIV